MSGAEYRTVELGDAIISVKFLRGSYQGEPGWWCIRQGKNIDYNEIGFKEARYFGKDAKGLSWRPRGKDAAAAVHLSFCDATGEGLLCPDASCGKVAVEGSMGFDAIGYVVIARRTRTERVHSEAPSQAQH